MMTVAPDIPSARPVIEIDDLRVSFSSVNGRIAALNGVSFHVEPGEVLAILGESGSGKSVTAAAIMGLIQQPPGRIESGTIRLDGVDVLALGASAHRQLCGDKVSLIFQDALAALNPVYPIGWQIAETFRIHGRLDRAAAAREAVRLLEQVGIPDAEKRARQYPHQFSGGMRQRVMIAMAVALGPDLVIADEPTTALDVTVQAQIVELMKSLLLARRSSLILITHDLGLVAEMASRVVVMYAGRIVEEASVERLFTAPAHPYTRGLFASQLRIDRRRGVLSPIRGMPPDPARLPSGCAFRPRCDVAIGSCAESIPGLRKVGGGRVACHLAVGDLS